MWQVGPQETDQKCLPPAFKVSYGFAPAGGCIGSFLLSPTLTIISFCPQLNGIAKTASFKITIRWVPLRAYLCIYLGWKLNDHSPTPHGIHSPSKKTKRKAGNTTKLICPKQLLETWAVRLQSSLRNECAFWAANKGRPVLQDRSLR